MKEHLSVIDSSNVESYKMLSKKILDIAKIKNKDRDYKVIENYLEE